jgi:hypothetical protein
MSQQKVNEYKAEKAGRRASLKKKRRIRNTVITLVCIAALGISAGCGFYYGNKKGYNKGYAEAAQLLSAQLNANSGNASKAAVTTDTASGEAAGSTTGSSAK